MTQPYEHCSICDSLTGKAGAADDSIFWLEGAIGPLCDECHDTLQAEVLDNAGLPANAADELERLQRFENQDQQIRESHGWKRDGRELPELVQAMADAVAKLPKCWRLVDGELKQDCPVVPGMDVWFAEGFESSTFRRCIVGEIGPHGNVRLWITEGVRCLGLNPSRECYNSLTAAKFAQQAEKRLTPDTTPPA